MRRAAIVILTLVVVGAAAFYLGTRLQSNQAQPPTIGPTGSNPTSPVSPSRGKSKNNPFGIFFNPQLFDIQTRVRLANELGVKYFRTTPVLVPAWNGQCAECSDVQGAGLQFILTIRNSDSVQSPASPPTDINAFKATVGQILDQYKPAVVVAENEENTPGFYTGSADQYGTELKAVCDVAHSKGIKCADGGIISESVTWMVYFNYVDRGQTAQAQSFAQRAFSGQAQAQIASGNTQEGKMVADRTMQFVDQLKTAGADYVNLHWYVPDAQALGESVSYFKKLTGLPVISNEMGQRQVDPSWVNNMLSEAFNLKMPVVVWFSSDARLAKALVDSNGSLRDTGQAFRTFVQQHVG